MTKKCVNSLTTACMPCLNLPSSGCACPCTAIKAYEWYREDAVGRAITQATAATADMQPLSPTSGGGEDEAVGRTEDSRAAQALSREDISVTTKIHPRDFSPERLRAVVETSRRNLHVRVRGGCFRCAIHQIRAGARRIHTLFFFCGAIA